MAQFMIGGYYLIEALESDAALAFCRDNPHLAAGGTAELRQIGGGPCPFTGLQPPPGH